MLNAYINVVVRRHCLLNPSITEFLYRGILKVQKIKTGNSNELDWSWQIQQPITSLDHGQEKVVFKDVRLQRPLRERKS